MDDIDVRTWALDRAIKEVGPGTPWENCFGLAAQYERYILHGTWATPVADAAKEPKPAEDAPHQFVPKSTMKSRCIICSKLHGEGNHK